MVIVDIELLKKAVANNCFSIKELLAKAGCSLSVWNRVKSGKPIRLASAGKIAKASGIPVEKLTNL